MLTSFQCCCVATFAIHAQCCLCIGGRIEGDVRINGHTKEQNSFARVSGYVEQFDTHSAAATVHEALMFSGILRNERDIDRDTTEAFVDQVRQHEGLCVLIDVAIQSSHAQRHSGKYERGVGQDTTKALQIR